MLLDVSDMDSPINGFHGIGYEFLSNFYPCSVAYNGITYPSAEHAYQAQKSGNNRVQKIFATLQTPGDAKVFGRALKVREDWDSIKDLVMYNVVYAKFTQNRDLSDRLIHTNKRTLVETNHWKDTYWGVCDGVGKNRLGEILMQVRKLFHEGNA